MDNDIYRKSLGETIKKARNERRLSQLALSEQTNIAQSTIVYLEKGE